VNLERRRAFEAPLTIGVISDTHIYPSSRRQVPPEALDLFRRAGVGLILHLGDVNTSGVLDELAEIAPVLAVSGNNDDDRLADILPERIRFTIGKRTFGAIHGHGGRSAREVVTNTFAGKVDMAFFGHSHIPYLGERNGTILFNPGSATERRWHPHFGIGVVRVEEEKIEPELIVYSNPAHLAGVEFGKADSLSISDKDDPE
jgi:putative phosphoesterase